jgi:hypothetical protein
MKNIFLAQVLVSMKAIKPSVAPNDIQMAQQSLHLVRTDPFELINTQLLVPKISPDEMMFCKTSPRLFELGRVY